MIGKAICPASCGEIVQGTIDGQDFLITCPIALYTEVTVELGHTKNRSAIEAKHIKAYTAAKRTLEYFGSKERKIHMRINSEIPRGIGLSSSTADIAATCLAVSSALGKTICPDVIADIALSIEPSDGIMYPGAWIFDHIYGKCRQRLSPIPDMDIYIIDTGESIDTQRFNDRHGLNEMNRRKEPQVREALDCVYDAFKRNDKQLLGDAMIKSGISHQPILHKQHFPEIVALRRSYGLLGVNIAHSGSALGIFFEKDKAIPAQFWEKVKHIMDKYHKSYQIIKTHIDNNGPRIVK